MKKVRRGDLVALYRRKKPGMGLVVKHVPDIFKCVPMQIEIEILFRQWKIAKSWKERELACNGFIGRSGLEESQAAAFLRYNAFQAVPSAEGIKNLKKEFVLVSWVHRPSNYEMKEMRERVGWYPAEWFKKVH